MQRIRRDVWLLPGVLALCLSACSSVGKGTPERQAVSGTVTLKGEPLSDGIIMFIPTSQDVSTQVSVNIVKGRFEVPADKGLLPGKYKVAISSPDGKTPVDSTEPPGPSGSTGSGNFPSKNRIPPEWNENSTIEVEVKAGEPNKFDYAIP
jgi:hypothetical protein